MIINIILLTLYTLVVFKAGEKIGEIKTINKMFNIPKIKKIEIRNKDKESNLSEVPEELREDLEKALEECLKELREVEIKEKSDSNE